MGDEANQMKNDDAEFIHLPNDIYETALNEIIKNNCNLSNQQCEIFCSAGSAKGDNYIGVVYRISVKSKEDNLEKLNLIIKLPPQNAARREQFFARPCFVREIDFYDNLYPLYKKFQEEKGIDVEKEGFHHVPFCYKTLVDDPYEGLYFEDLKAKGFEMFDRHKNVTKEQVVLVMKSLAKFHAISYSIKDQTPELIQSYQELTDIFLQRKGDNNMNIWFETIKNQARDTISELTNPDLIDKLDNILKLNFFELLECCIESKAAEPYAVICHGDVSNENCFNLNS